MTTNINLNRMYSVSNRFDCYLTQGFYFKFNLYYYSTTLSHIQIELFSILCNVYCFIQTFRVLCYAMLLQFHPTEDIFLKFMNFLELIDGRLLLINEKIFLFNCYTHYAIDLINIASYDLLQFGRKPNDQKSQIY